MYESGRAGKKGVLTCAISIGPKPPTGSSILGRERSGRMFSRNGVPEVSSEVLSQFGIRNRC